MHSCMSCLRFISSDRLIIADYLSHADYYLPRRQTDLAPTALASEPIPKGLARVLDAEKVRAAYRKRRAEEETKSGGPGTEARGKAEVKLLPGESLREFNRYAGRVSVVSVLMCEQTSGRCA